MSGPAAPALVRCVDLPRALAGATPETVERAIQSLAAQLKQLGWRAISEAPGMRTYANGGRMLALDQLIPMFVGGYISEEHWSATCATDRISELMVPLPAALAATAGAAPRAYRDPFAVPVEQFPDLATKPPSRGMTAARIAVIVVSLAFIGYVRVIQPAQIDNHLAHHCCTAGEIEVKTDGKLTVNGGHASITYAKQPHEFESREIERETLNYPDQTAMESAQLNKWVTNGRDRIALYHVRHNVDLTRPRNYALWLNNRNVSEWRTAGHYVDAEKTTIDGRPALRWEYMTDRGWWEYGVRVPLRTTSYSADCRLMPVSDTPENRRRCLRAVNSMQIAEGAS